MRLYKLTMLGMLLINRALARKDGKDLTLDEAREAIQNETIFKVLDEVLDSKVALSYLSPLDRLELLIEWGDFELAFTPGELGIQKSGLLLLLTFVLEGIQRRASDAKYRLDEELAMRDLGND